VISHVGHLLDDAVMSPAPLAAAAMDDNVADEGCALDAVANISDGESAMHMCVCVCVDDMFVLTSVSLLQYILQHTLLRRKPLTECACHGGTC